MIIIRRLKDRIKDLDYKNKVYVCLKPLQDNGFIRCGIVKISKTPTGLTLMIERGISETKTIKNLKIMLRDCQDEDNLGYILIEDVDVIFRAGNIDGFQIIDRHLYLTSILYPRMV